MEQFAFFSSTSMKIFSINFDHIKRLMLVLSARNHVIICKANKMFEKKTVIFIEQYMQYKIKKTNKPFFRSFTLQNSICNNYQILNISFLLFKYKSYLYNMCRDIRNGCQSLFDRICKFLWPKYALLMLSIKIIKNAELKTLPCLTPDSELNNIMYENIFYLLFYYTCTWII